MKVNILGSAWKINRKFENEDERLRTREGFCDFTVREIVVARRYGEPQNDFSRNNVFVKKVIRHEIVHAFLYESGLAENSLSHAAWSENEEMIDWFAFQGPKIYKAWEEAGALPGMLEVQE